MAHFYLLAPLPGAEEFAEAKARGLLLEPDFNDYFKNHPMRKHPTMSPADLQREHATAVHGFYSWTNVVARVVRGALGLGRGRCAVPFTFAKRQLGFKLMVAAGLHSYYEGGLFRRRGARWRAPREVVHDEEARAHYLGTRAPVPSHLPAAFADDSTMESLPILRRHGLSV